MATNTHFILTLQPRYPYSPSSSSSSSFPFILTNTALSFSHLRFGSLPLSLNFRASFSFKSPTSTISAFSDAEEDEEEEEEDEEDDEEEEEDEDDDVAADEYDDVSADASEDDAGVFARHDGFKWQRVEKLCNEVREFGADIIDVEELAAVYDFRIDKFQRQAILAFLRGSSVVVSAPTSSGKTLIAEAAAVATVARGRRLFYTTPLKALSNQKFREFRETFGDSNVGLLTGDSAVNKDAQVLIMTTEILRNMLYQRKLSFNYLQLQAAGAKPYKDDWSRKRNSRKRGTRFSYDSDDNMFEQRSLSKNDINAIRRSQVPQVIDTLWQLQSRDMLPAIWFIFSRKGCDAAVQYLENCKLLDECESTEVELALKKFRKQYPDAVRDSAVRGLLQGVAAHHAGCLPLWKAFIEELFQRGLIKVVFATETLAAGINMPARTAVISSLSKRGDSGRIPLSSNELLQMAGRAGRRGIDESGHVVLIQTTNEGAEEGCKVLFAGLEPLVSQFTASYGMVLNLLAGVKAIQWSNESGNMKPSTGRTLEEARKLVEQSFGNYVSSNVMLAAKEELNKIEKEIELLMSETTDEAIDRKTRKALAPRQYKEIAELLEDLRSEKRVRTKLRKQVEAKRMSALKPLLEETESGHLPFLCLQYRDAEGVEHSIPAVFLGKVDSLNASKLKTMISSVDSFALNLAEAEPSVADSALNKDIKPSYHVALGSDNTWYLFTEKWIKTVYGTGFPNVPLAQGDARPREIMSTLLDNGDMNWDKLSQSEHGGLWFMEGSLDTWSWSLNVPVLSSLSENDELLLKSQDYKDAIECYKDQRNKVSRLKKKISRSEGYKEYFKITDTVKFVEEKIKRLKNRSKRLINRIEQIEPSGWKEFMQVSNVIHEIRALDINTHVIFPLGETAGAIRGENELWLAMVLRNKILLDLKPAQLAAVCASLVSVGIKVRPWKNNSYIYEPSATVTKFITLLDEQRNALLALQDKHGVTISCCLDNQFCGMVEAWASGLTWREIMMDCAMDDGDLARLLRRTIDLLVQIPKLPDIDPLLQRNAKAASAVMDRPPISELVG
ncbi:DExH-box ATP-dependent RNA helicase DExH15 chloroplastic isoform X2 [Vigna unguiculata]|uniref:DExH-box ATP-dependent RNA helicase DExH15 chloroplastic isoform X2 n=1 Tax=Vigna unguiculata TaxID=3917 RepID=UPI0010164D47|nr:DExH-box ATP-dependent RNA helicase DExH15 chloroplastic isoform X2 [Vigna unguiculata]